MNADRLNTDRQTTGRGATAVERAEDRAADTLLWYKGRACSGAPNEEAIIGLIADLMLWADWEWAEWHSRAWDMAAQDRYASREVAP